MRIITGTLKNRRLTLPKGVETRPTADRTKESLFNIITVRKGFEDAKVLDLFSGSGNLAFEAISRGASNAICVEKNRNCALFIGKNAEALEIDSQITVITGDALGYLNGSSSPYDLIFADPPYDYPFMSGIVEKVLGENWLDEEGWLILEHDIRHNFSSHPHCVFTKPYGRTCVSIFLKYPVDEETEQ